MSYPVRTSALFVRACTHRSALVAATLLMGACDTPTAPLRKSLPAAVQVAPGKVSAQRGDTVRLSAVVLDAASRVLASPVQWSSSDTTRAVVSPAGVVQARGDGAVTLTASTAEGVTGSATLTVDPRRAASLAVQPGSLDLLPGQSVQLRAVVRDSSGALLEGRQIAWASSRPDVLEVRAGGLASARGEDAQVTVRATVGGLVAEARVRVLPDPCTPASPLATGQTVTGSLADTQCRLTHGGYAARWRLDLGTDARVRIDLSSSDFDPYLILTDLSGNVVEVDDDAGGAGGAARITGPVLAGSYIVWATSAGSGPRGRYTLSVQPETRSGCADGMSIAVGRAVTGYLSVLDCRYSAGEFVDRWRIDLGTATTLRAVMQSSEVDAFLTLTDLQGNPILWDEDGAGGSDAAIATRLPAGSYLLWASSEAGGDRGRYTLSVRAELESSCRSVQPVSLGRDVSGYLTANDCTLAGGYYTDRWRVDLARSRRLSVDLYSRDFAGYVRVTDLQGRTLAEAADGLDADLPAGSYIVWATTSAPFRTGEYLLSVR